MRVAFLAMCLFFAFSGVSSASWRVLAPGLETKEFPIVRPGVESNSRFVVIRIDPGLWDLVFLNVKSRDELPGFTTKQWSSRYGLTAAINSGMFAKDYMTHVGYVRYRGKTINPKKNKYQSVAAFDPHRAKSPRFRIFDLDGPGVSLQAIVRDYGSAIQNLRLIKRPKINRWPQQEKRWSEAALGEDSSGRILFIFCRTPLSMHDLNTELLRSGLGLVCAQHLEGGPPAQLYLKAGSVEMELMGSYETSIREDDENRKPWPLPSVIGVRPKRFPKGEPRKTISR